MAKIQPDRISTTIDANTKPIQEKIHALTKETKELSNQNRDLRRKISELAAQEGDFSAEIGRLNAQITENTRKMDENKREIGKLESSLSLSGKTAAQLGKQLKDLKRELANCSRAAEPERYKKLEKQIREVERAHAAATRSSQGFLSSLLSLDKWSTAIKGFFMGLAAVIGTQVIGAFKNLKNTIQEFAASNSKLAAILGTTTEGIKSLTEQAKELGRTTSFTASEVTGLQIELAKLGFSMSQIESMTPGVLKFAKAVDTDLPGAAAFAGATLRIFGKDASQTEDVLASLAIATTKSALDFTKLQGSMSTIGPVAAAYGLSLEDTTALLGVLANSGFDASTAATATRNILLNLCDVNGQLARSLGGPVNNLDDLVAGLNKLNAEGVDLAKAFELTDKRSVSAFSNFLKNADSLTELRDSISNVNSEFNQMSETMAKNSAAAEKGFYSAIEGLILKFGGLDNILKVFYNTGAAVVRFIGEAIEVFTPFVNIIKFLGSVLATVVGWIGKILTPIGQWLKQTGVLNVILKTLAGIVSTLVTAWAAYKTAMMAAAAWSKLMALNIKSKVVALWAEVKATFAAKTAQDGLNASMKANPILAIISLVVALVAVIGTFISKTKEAKAAQEDLNKIKEEAARKMTEEKLRLELLLKAAQNEKLSLDERKRAINELNKIIPNYNAQLDQTTGKYKANKKALDDYIASLARKYELEGAKDYLAEIGKQKAKLVADKADKLNELWGYEMSEYNNRENYIMTGGLYSDGVPEDYLNKSTFDTYPIRVLRAQISGLDDQIGQLESRKNQILQLYGVDLQKEAIEGAETVNTNITTPLNNASNAADNAVQRLREINDELKRLRKMEPQSNDELHQIQARIKALKEEKKEILGKAEVKKKLKKDPGTYSEDSLVEATAAADDKHQKNVLDINKKKGEISEADFIIEKNKELIRYCGDLMTSLNELREKTDQTHTQTLDKIRAEQIRIAQQQAAAELELKRAYAIKNREVYEQKIAAADAYYSHLELRTREAVEDQEITQGQADIFLLTEQKRLHSEQLKALEEYYRTVENSDHLGAEEKRRELEKLGGQILSLQSQILTDTGKWSETLRGLMTDTTSEAGITDSFTRQRQEIEATYRAAIEIVGEGTEEAYALEQEKQRRIDALNFEQLNKLYQLQELTGVSWAQEYNHELALLENYHRQGMISEQNYQKAKLQLQVNNVKKYYDYYSQLTGSMFTAIQDAEIAASEAKYDVLIRQAENNGEDTAALEQEKENKKLEIQKKYADVNFAIKISEIIANTAVAIMQAFAQLGPIGGAIAAAMLTATGIAQVVVAKAERDKVKNMQPGNASGAASGASTPATAERVLTGFSEGGYTGDGDRYEVAGVVHRGEYVVPKPIMDNPRVVDAVGTIEAIRRNKLIASAPVDNPGFADGGYTGAGQSGGSPELTEAIRELRTAVAGLDNIRAYVVFKDLEKARDTMDRARSPFTRNKN